MRPIAIALLAALSAALLAAPPAGARTEGPFKAQLVDEDTGQPIPGVVVVALYMRKVPAGIHPESHFYDLDETVSDADGRITLPARQLPISTPLSHIVGPQPIIFKAGYKSWRFEGVQLGQHVDPAVRDEQQEEGWRKFRTEGAVIKMVRARTLEERGLARSFARRFPPIPDDRAPRLQEALEAESRFIQRVR